jgi:hypothetical protein
MALRLKNLPSARLKNDFCEIDEAKFHRVERPNKHFLNAEHRKKLPNGRHKNDFVKVNETIKQGIFRPYELIFGFL